MLTTNIILGCVIGLVLGAVMIACRRHFRDVFGALLVLGVVVLAVAVTFYRVQQYRAEPPAPAPEAAMTQPQAGPASGSSMPPMGRQAIIPPATPVLPSSGATGGAAPEPAKNPYIKAGNG